MLTELQSALCAYALYIIHAFKFFPVFKVAKLPPFHQENLALVGVFIISVFRNTAKTLTETELQYSNMPGCHGEMTIM